MSRVGQLRIGAAWIGNKNRDLTASGNLRFYDKRCRCRILLGAEVRGQIAKNSIWRIRHGNGIPGAPRNKIFQEHFKYYKNIGAPGTPLAAIQDAFKIATNEIKALKPEQRAPYKAMELQNFNNRHKHPGTYKARAWPHYYLMERLPVLYKELGLT